eukprot:s2125_g7.t1
MLTSCSATTWDGSGLGVPALAIVAAMACARAKGVKATTAMKATKAKKANRGVSALSGTRSPQQTLESKSWTPRTRMRCDVAA